MNNKLSKYKELRKYQRQLTKMIRKANKMLEEDPLFLGRFCVYQVNRQCEWFSDNSGGIIVAFIRAFDKKTGHFKDYRYEYAPYFSSKYWHFDMDILNNFIVEVSDFWKEEPHHTINNAEDFRKIKIPYRYLQPKWRDMKFHARGCIYEN